MDQNLSHTKPFQDPMIQQPVRHGRGAALAKVLRTPEVVKAFLEPPASCKGNPLGRCPMGKKIKTETTNSGILNCDIGIYPAKMVGLSIKHGDFSGKS